MLIYTATGEMTWQEKKTYLRSITGHHRNIFYVGEQQIVIVCSSTIRFSPDQGAEHVASFSSSHRRNFLRRLWLMSGEKLTWVFSVLPMINLEEDEWNLCSNSRVKYRQKNFVENKHKATVHLPRKNPSAWMDLAK